MKAQGPPLTENLGNLLLDTDKLREAVSSNQTSMHKASMGLTEQLALLQELIDMKTNATITHGILKTGQEPLLHWKQSLEFIIKSSIRYEHELKDVQDLVQKVMDKIFEHLKVLHTESYISNNGQLIDIERMKAKFLAFVE